MSKELIWKQFEEYCLSFKFNVTYDIISHHPLFSSPVYFNGDKLEPIHPNNLTRYVKLRLKALRPLFDKSPSKLLLATNKPYSLDVFEILNSLFSEKQYNHNLHMVWTNVEFPHQNGIRKIKKLFDKTKPNLIMNKYDLNTFQGLPPKIKIFRGIKNTKEKTIRGFSWSTSLDKARWFSERWEGEGEIYSALINKEDIYFLTSERGESEVIVNPYKLKELTLINDDN